MITSHQRMIRMRQSFEKNKSVLTVDYKYFATPDAPATPRVSIHRSKVAHRSNGAWRHIIHDESGKRIDVAPRKRSLTLFEARDDAESKTPGVSKFLDWDASFVNLPPLRAASFSILTRPHFDSANHRRLMMGTLPLASRASTYKAFVYLDGMRLTNGIAVGPHHTGAEFMKHCERRLIGSDVKLALELNCRLPGRLCRHEIGAPKPSREWHVARLHHCPSGERRILFTGATAQHNRRASCETVRVGPKSSLTQTKLSEHETNRGEAEKSEC